MACGMLAKRGVCAPCDPNTALSHLRAVAAGSVCPAILQQPFRFKFLRSNEKREKPPQEIVLALRSADSRVREVEVTRCFSPASRGSRYAECGRRASLLIHFGAVDCSTEEPTREYTDGRVGDVRFKGADQRPSCRIRSVTTALAEGQLEGCDGAESLLGEGRRRDLATVAFVTDGYLDASLQGPLCATVCNWIGPSKGRSSSGTVVAILAPLHHVAGGHDSFETSRARRNVDVSVSSSVPHPPDARLPAHSLSACIGYSNGLLIGYRRADDGEEIVALRTLQRCTFQAVVLTQRYLEGEADSVFSVAITTQNLSLVIVTGCALLQGQEEVRTPQKAAFTPVPLPSVPGRHLRRTMSSGRKEDADDADRGVSQNMRGQHDALLQLSLETRGSSGGGATLRHEKKFRKKRAASRSNANGFTAETYARQRENTEAAQASVPRLSAHCCAERA
ncbi:unnamed protein product [Rangifer tarandus platyrhynchus]|uniref:Uncharacterized protein n=1 Tax=Rangifer tarandus platyrhynchus TaxID=3082113 RepID=A0ABN8XPK3_RANTA|nr:unnamed protein product [Rangifer tarandus platyrhynchus]